LVRSPRSLAARRLGFPDTYVFHDIYGFDPVLLAMARDA
jgi:hypothetical protein